MTFDYWPNVVKNRAEHILSGFEYWALTNRFAVGSKLLIETIDIDDEPEAAKSTVTQLIWRDSKMAVDYIHQTTKNINKKTITAPDLKCLLLLIPINQCCFRPSASIPSPSSMTTIDKHQRRNEGPLAFGEFRACGGGREAVRSGASSTV